MIRLLIGLLIVGHTLCIACPLRIMVCKECGMPAGLHSVGCSRYEGKDRMASRGESYSHTFEPSYDRYAGMGK